MVDLIVWSKDRSCQLSCLIQSIYECTPADLFSRIYVLMKYSSHEFERGYMRFSEEFPNIEVIPEEDFYEDTCRLVNLAGKFVCFSTDDNVIYRDFDLDLNKTGFVNKPQSVFSLRLGYNTVVQDIHADPPTYQPYLHFRTEEDGILCWNPKHYRQLCNYGYPMSLDMHIFHSDFIKSILPNIHFDNTNQMESRLFEYGHYVTHMFALTESVSVNIPCNNLSQVTKAGKFHPYSPEWLNKQYLSGKRISLSEIMEQEINGCHAELPLILY